MKVKKHMIVSIILLAILIMGAVSASEDITDDTSDLSVSDDAISEDGLTVSNEGADSGSAPLANAPSTNVGINDEGSISNQAIDDEVILGEGDDDGEDEEGSPYERNGFDPILRDEEWITDDWEVVVDINTPDEGEFSISVQDENENQWNISHEVNDDDREQGYITWTFADLGISEPGDYFLTAKFIFPSTEEETIFENHRLRINGPFYMRDGLIIYKELVGLNTGDRELSGGIAVVDSGTGYVYFNKTFAEIGFNDHMMGYIFNQYYGYYVFAKDLEGIVTGEYNLTAIHYDDEGNVIESLERSVILDVDTSIIDGEVDITDDESVLINAYIFEMYNEGLLVLGQWIEDDEGDRFVTLYTRPITQEDIGTVLRLTNGDLELEEGDYQVELGIAFNDEEPSEFEYRLDYDGIINIVDNSKFRIRLGDISIFYTNEVFFVYCPESSANSVITIRNGDYSFDHTITEEEAGHYIGFTLDNLNINVPNIYFLDILDGDGEAIIEDYEFEIYNPFEFKEICVAGGDERNRIVELLAPEGFSEGSVILTDEDVTELFNKPLSELDYYSEGYEEGFIRYYITYADLNTPLDLNQVYKFYASYIGYRQFEAEGEVNIVERTIDEKDGVTIELFNHWGHDLRDDEDAFAIVKAPTDEGYVIVQVDEWERRYTLYDDDGQWMVHIHPCDVEVDSGTYPVTVIYFNAEDEEVLRLSADIEFYRDDDDDGPSIFIPWTGHQESSYWINSENMVNIYPYDDDFDSIRIIVKIGDETYLDAYLADLNLKPRYDDDGKKYYTVGPVNFNIPMGFGHYENIVAYYIGEKYQMDTSDHDWDPDFVDIIGMIDEVEYADTETTVMAINPNRNGQIVLYVCNNSDGNWLEPIYFDCTENEFLYLKTTDLNLDPGNYRIEVKYDNDDWIFDGNLLVVDKSDFYIKFKCDWFYTTDEVLWVWCPENGEGTITIAGQNIVGAEYTITDGDKGTYIGFTLSDLGISSPGWDEIVVSVDGVEIAREGFDVPNPIQMPNTNVYLPEDGIDSVDSMKIAQLDIPSDASGTITITVDGEVVLNKDLAEFLNRAVESRVSVKIYTSDLETPIEEGMHYVVVKFNDMQCEKALNFRQKSTTSEEGISITILEGNHCAYWDDIIAEIIAPMSANGRVVVELDGMEVSGWDELHQMDVENYDESNNYYIIKVYHLSNTDFGEHTLKVTYFVNEECTVSSEGSILFMGDAANQVGLWDYFDHGDKELDVDWFHIQPNGHTGTVVLTVNGVEYLNKSVDELREADWGGEYLFTPREVGLGPGYYEDVVIAFYCDEDYSYQIYRLPNGDTIVDPDKAYPNLEIADIVDVQEGSDVTITISANDAFSGVVAVTVNGNDAGTATLTAGAGSFTIDADKLVVGVNTVVVSFAGDEQFNAGSASKSFNVVALPVDPELVISPVADVDEGSPVTIIINSNAGYCGDVTVTVNGEVVGTATLMNCAGSYTISADKLNVGVNTVKVSSEAAAGFIAGESAVVSFSVVALPVDPELTISVENIDYGTDATVVITTNATFTGVVKVQIGDINTTVTVTSGTGSTLVSGLDVGNYNVKAIFEATDVFAYSEVETTFVVNKATATVSSEDVTVTYPNASSVTIAASVAGEYNVKVGDRTYPVTVTENGGSASVPVAVMDVGQYEISVTADLGNNYNPIDTGVINYYKVLAGSIIVSGQGTTVTYPGKGTIVINTDVAGDYSIKVGDKTYDATLVAGANSFDVSDVFDAGVYDVKVSVDIPNYNVIVDQSIASYTVGKAASSVVVGPISFTYGGSGSGTVTLDGATGFTAAIDGYPDAVSVSGNVISVSGLPVDTYVMVVTTVPDANHEAVSINVAVTVGKVASAVSVDPISFTYGGSGSANVSLGNSTLDLSGISVVNHSEAKISLSGNVITVSGLNAGKYVLRVTNTPNANYDGCTVLTNITVSKLATNLVAPKVSATYNVAKKLVVTLKDGNGNLLANKKVTIKVGTISKTLTTNEKGQVSVAVQTLVPKTYTATIIFAGDSNYEASSVKPKVVVAKAKPKLSAAKKTFKVKTKTKKVTATLKNNKGKVMKKIKLTLKIGKTTYKATTNKKGVATFKVKLTKKGKYTAKVKFAGNKYYKALSKKVAITVKG